MRKMTEEQIEWIRAREKAEVEGYPAPVAPRGPNVSFLPDAGIVVPIKPQGEKILSKKKPKIVRMCYGEPSDYYFRVDDGPPVRFSDIDDFLSDFLPTLGIEFETYNEYDLLEEGCIEDFAGEYIKDDDNGESTIDY